ncbi:MAG: hypothetical protein EXS64_19605 [Candidatus Latescibacteria bacterium]|nr:hypothetical protein [Candidatus Latescibacterota bacterium]
MEVPHENPSQHRAPRRPARPHPRRLPGRGGPHSHRPGEGPGPDAGGRSRVRGIQPGDVRPGGETPLGTGGERGRGRPSLQGIRRERCDSHQLQGPHRHRPGRAGHGPAPGADPGRRLFLPASDLGRRRPHPADDVGTDGHDHGHPRHGRHRCRAGQTRPRLRHACDRRGPGGRDPAPRRGGHSRDGPAERPPVRIRRGRRLRPPHPADRGPDRSERLPPDEAHGPPDQRHARPHRGRRRPLQALEQKLIAGAGLDVVPWEPLPDDHPLWRMENVVLTPHVAGGSPHRVQRNVALFCENLMRLLAGQPLTSVIDKRKGY